MPIGVPVRRGAGSRYDIYIDKASSEDARTEYREEKV
jgi:hypothetical protein